jgi:hypothetical protein
METLHYASNESARVAGLEAPSERALNAAALVAMFALLALAITTYVLLKMA